MKEMEEIKILIVDDIKESSLSTGDLTKRESV